MPPAIFRHDHDLLDGEDRARAHLVVPDVRRVDLRAALQVHGLAQDQPEPELAGMLPREHGLDPIAGFDPWFGAGPVAAGDRVVVVRRKLAPGRVGLVHARYRHLCHEAKARPPMTASATSSRGCP